VEQKHICEALVFELSKCNRLDIRERMVSHLINIHEDLAGGVARGLGFTELAPADAAMPTRQDLAPSDKLSIIKNGPKSFKGRKVGVLVTDGVNADVYRALKEVVEARGGIVKVVAPTVGGVTDSNGTSLPADEKLAGGPSVLFDAVVILASEEGAAALAKDPHARDFVCDAFAHCKFIGYTQASNLLLQRAGGADILDDGCFLLDSPKSAEAFVEKCPELSCWEREMRM